jgi:hypothetical protein
MEGVTTTVRHEPFCTVVLVHDGRRPWEVYIEDNGDGDPVRGSTIATAPTPGAALDAAVRWAQQRGLQVSVNALALDVYRLVRGPTP